MTDPTITPARDSQIVMILDAACDACRRHSEMLALRIEADRATIERLEAENLKCYCRCKEKP